MPVTEGDTVRFICSTTVIPRIMTFEDSYGKIASWFTADSSCTVLGTVNTAYFNATCDVTNLRFYLEILDISSSYHNTILSCEAQYDTSLEDIAEVFITINVNGKSAQNITTYLVVNG